MKSVLAKQEDGSIQLTITIPSDVVKKTQEDVVKHFVEHAQLPGFRKGKAPKKMVEDRMDPSTTREETLKKLLPQFYVEAITEHTLKPIISPRIHVSKVDPDKDWEFTATTCEMPEVDLGTYKENIQKVTAKSKIIIPGKDLPAGQPGSQEPKFDDVMNALIEGVTVKIPVVMIEAEADRLLSQLLEDIKKLGLTLEQYMSSTNNTPEKLRDEYKKKVETDLKLEFALQKLAEAEKITVDEKEIDEAIRKAKDDTERKNLEANRHLLASILRQQKTLDFIKNL